MVWFFSYMYIFFLNMKKYDQEGLAFLSKDKKSYHIDSEINIFIFMIYTIYVKK